MKKLLIIKTGTTFPSILKDHGDFEDFIINRIGTIPYSSYCIWSVYKHEPPPDLVDIAGIIITGSHAMVSDFEDWNVRLSDWLRENLHMAIPTLGICYGHQLLCQALGGQVTYHPQGKEIGTVQIQQTEAGKNDPLFSVLPSTFLGHVTHAQTILNLPPGAHILANNDFEEHHAFALHDTIWGVQFHPEFDAAITQAYIKEQESSLISEGYAVESIKNSVTDHSFGRLLFQRFLEISNL
ncbi:GMP synthase family protein [Desulfosporosinus orientis DSM 765]|uniref:GMP synthase family protein n=1 Tax=Desulfosporosinus orientis (strain ATCC 19365 / DSM 765 / NCIMB 8382 / VKM B-1628 / Singapore I) TaxID=768706 RepID=G7WJM9_DESOD|nr:glutamine amidotransferase [Desulfosporosinus orientis]AET70466.1 GMP synthase family protein [Desulfosporosinus orientis DSM 765]